ncbi:SRPBCC domain-containing protein [Planktotalea sp.]|uniref:SRPBCC domain-containing protein n=1 Tax=Planktotalea sp. TaxID=2029877 RepID=UPI003297A830
MIEPVEVHVVLDSTPEQAFKAFTDNINSWWPVESHSICKGTVKLDPTLGGEIIETGADGQTHVWGHVTEWTPPNSLKIEWYVGRTPAEGTQIHVTFLATDDGRVGVTLVHSGWEILGESALETRDMYQSGWSGMLNGCYAPHLASLA